MATLKDLERVFNAEPRLTPGTVRMITRLLQDGGILPKVRRGFGRGPQPQITAEHCAAWLVGLAVTRRSGLRNVADATERVKRVMKLVSPVLKPATFGENLAGLIQNYIDGTHHEKRIVHRILIANDEVSPWAEFLVSVREQEEDEPDFKDAIFREPKAWAEMEESDGSRKPIQFTDAFVINSEVFWRFREIFKQEVDAA